ncbi:ubiquinone biosynthesis hydrox [Trametopsis cervina]|nr:ubiquinone biosynthesis hydrox [Trametopsis cervina]
MLRSVGSRTQSFSRQAYLRRASTTALERDVVIVGGGPAGLALAGALASTKLARDALKVTLIEASDLAQINDWNPAPGTYSNRVSSITNSSQTFLQKIGAWQHVEDTRTRQIDEMQVWDGISDARIRFSVEDVPLQSSSQIARLTENLNLQRGLLRHLAQYPELELASNVKVQSIVKEERQGGGWPLIHLSDGRVLRARLLVGADGFNSPVRAYANINSYGWAYDTHGIVATLFHAPRNLLHGPNTVAYQRFLPTGPIAFLPLSETASSLVWSTTPELAAVLKTLDPNVFVGMINAAFRLPEVSIRYLHDEILAAQANGSPLTPTKFLEELRFRERSHRIDAKSALFSGDAGGPTGIPPDGAHLLPPLVSAVQHGTVASFPLRFSHADTYIGEGNGARTVLVGDAAHTIHPLAGQGLNLGLADVECLAECITNAVRLGGDVGAHTALQPYARNRYFENHKTLSACDKLHKLYSSTSEPIVWARSAGLEVLNELDTIKGALMMAAGTVKEHYGTGQVGWELTAKAVEGLARNMDNARMLGNSVSGMAGSTVRQLLQGLTRGGP